MLSKVVPICAGDVTHSIPALQAGRGGQNPTPALQFTQDVNGAGVREFVCDNHYSRKCPPSKFYFSAWFAPKIATHRVGACVFNAPQLPKIAKCYEVDLELNRLVLLDECPKNSESRFIGWALRWLRKNTQFKKVISYADPRFGHLGTIYRASNFQYVGTEQGHGTRRIFVDGVEYHPSTAFCKWGCSGAKLQEILPNSKVIVEVMPKKHVFVFRLK